VDYNVASAREHALQGKLDEWIDSYLNEAAWANHGLSNIIRHQKPLWVGPIEVELTQLIRCCGPEEGIHYQKDPDEWEQSIIDIVNTLNDPRDLPPLIVRFAHGVYGIPDGNHRHEAIRRKGWKTAWVIIWCDRDEKFKGSYRSKEV
jgi:hypothetical protein